MKRARRLNFGVSIPLALILAAGCTGPGNDAQPAADAPEVLEHTHGRGPFDLTLRLEPENPTIADRIKLEFEAVVDEDYELAWPEFGETLSQFGIADYRIGSSELMEGGRRREVREYVLEPFLSGSYRIPPLKFVFAREGEEPHRLQTEEIALEVESLLEEEAAALEIRDIVAPVELPRERNPARFWIVLAIAVLVLAGMAAGWWWLRRQRTPGAGPLRPAHEIAYRELRELVAADWPGKGETKRFYREISAILRRYLENRFGVHAPGQTTEEFLSDPRTRDLLPPAQQELLRELLNHCDLVKFAELDVGKPEIQRTFDACKTIIETTKVEEERQREPKPEPEAA